MIDNYDPEKVLAFFGIESQLIKLMEECSELIKSSAKILTTSEASISDFAEEIADVEIMIEQFKSLPIKPQIEIIKNFKKERIARFMLKEKHSLERIISKTENINKLLEGLVNDQPE